MGWAERRAALGSSQRLALFGGKLSKIAGINRLFRRLNVRLVCPFMSLGPLFGAGSLNVQTSLMWQARSVNVQTFMFALVGV